MIDLSNHCNHSDCPHYVYITLGINEKKGFFYVGQHKCKRIGEHDSCYYGSGKIIRNIEKKYGFQYIIDNFRNIPIWWCKSKQEADEMEIMFIEYYKSMEVGYNLCEGGGGISNPSETTRRKMRESHLGKPSPNKGIPKTEEQKRKQSIAMTGKPSPNKGKHLSEEVKLKISNALKGRVSWNLGRVRSAEARQNMSNAHKGQITWMKGKHHTEEAKEKNRLAHLGKPSPRKGVKLSDDTKRKLSASKIGKHCGKDSSSFKGTIQAIKDGIVVAELNGKKEIDAFVGKDGADKNVFSVITGKRKSAYGYQWKRLPKEES